MSADFGGVEVSLFCPRILSPFEVLLDTWHRLLLDLRLSFVYFFTATAVVEFVCLIKKLIRVSAHAILLMCVQGFPSTRLSHILAGVSICAVARTRATPWSLGATA